MHTLEIDKSTPISRRGAGERSTSTCYESQEETSKKHCHVFRNHLYWLCQGSLLPDLCNWCTVQLIAVHFTKLSCHCGSCTTQFVSLCGLVMVFALSPKRLTHLCTCSLHVLVSGSVDPCLPSLWSDYPHKPATAHQNGPSIPLSIVPIIYFIFLSLFSGKCQMRDGPTPGAPWSDH